MRVKFVLIDRHHRRKGTYAHAVHELDYETTLSDPLEIGREIHDSRFGAEDRRWFVKVLGVEG